MNVLFTAILSLMMGVPIYASTRDQNITPGGKPLIPVEEFDEVPFKAQVDKILKFMETYKAGHDMVPKVKFFWQSTGISAKADIQGVAGEETQRWIIWTSGGLIRSPLITPDSFLSTLCHESGHILAGYPFDRVGVHGATLEYSTEGEADYFASSVCLPRIWKSEVETNLQIYQQATQDELNHCQQVYDEPNDIGICVRTLRADETRLKFYVVEADRSVEDSFLSPVLKVSRLFIEHPSTGCRMETSRRGVLCRSRYPSDRNPTFGMTNDEKAQKISDPFYCEDNPIARRPSCWYHEPSPKYAPFMVGLGSTEVGSAFLFEDEGKVMHVGRSDLSSTFLRARILTEDLSLDDIGFTGSFKQPHGVFYSPPIESLVELKERGFKPFVKSKRLIQEGMVVEVLSFLSAGKYECHIEAREGSEWSLEPRCQLHFKNDLGSPVVLKETREVVGVVTRIKSSPEKTRSMIKAL